jgi:DNA polymerase III gamma/tau subunit
VLATGSIADAQPPFDVLLAALGSSDAVGAISALAQLTRGGWDPEQLGESLAAELRQIFLLLVAPDVSDALDIDRDRLAQWGRDLGLPRTVRALETVGRTLREMKSSPVPIVMLEVALVRLTRPDLDESISALDERLSRLERSVAQGNSASSTASPAPSRPIGSLSRTSPSPSPSPSHSVAAPRDETVTSPEPEPAEVVSNEITPTPPPPLISPSEVTVASVVAELSEDDFRDRFTYKVMPRLARSAQTVFTMGRIKSLVGTTLTIALPSEQIRSEAEKIQSGLRSALEHEFQTSIHIMWTVDGSIDVRADEIAAAPRAPATVDGDDNLSDRDIAESETADSDSVARLLITEAFPGAEELT